MGFGVPVRNEMILCTRRFVYWIAVNVVIANKCRSRWGGPLAPSSLSIYPTAYSTRVHIYQASQTHCAQAQTFPATPVPASPRPANPLATDFPLSVNRNSVLSTAKARQWCSPLCYSPGLSHGVRNSAIFTFKTPPRSVVLLPPRPNQYLLLLRLVKLLPNCFPHPTLPAFPSLVRQQADFS